MVSRENAVTLLFVAVGLTLAYAGRVLTDVSDTVLLGVLLLVGVIAPLLVNDYFDARETA
ncbi:MAG: hypothetical protein ACOCQL_05495 [Halolamina sp.]